MVDNKVCNSKLELIIGPMFAGKSTELLKRIRRYTLSSKNILIVGIRMDSRSGEYICTHDQQKLSLTLVDKLSEIFETSKYIESDVIVFDEAQFFPELIGDVKQCLSDSKIVLCAGLSGTYKLTPFDNISQLISIATDITFLKAICTHTNQNGKICGNDAPYTIKYNDSNNTIIETGGSDVYAPRCLTHYYSQ